MTFDAIDSSFPVFALALILAFFCAVFWIAALCLIAKRSEEAYARIRAVPPLTEAGGGSLPPSARPEVLDTLAVITASGREGK